MSDILRAKKTHVQISNIAVVNKKYNKIMINCLNIQTAWTLLHHVTNMSDSERDFFFPWNIIPAANQQWFRMYLSQMSYFDYESYLLSEDLSSTS